MPRLWNADYQPAVVHPNAPAVKPGESWDFSDEQVENGITGNWSPVDPNAGISPANDADQVDTPWPATTTTEPDSVPATDEEE